MLSDRNLILLTDSYKVSHWKQYPPGTTQVYSYYESRGGLFPRTMFFGLQYILQKYFCARIDELHIKEAEGFFGMHFGNKSIFNRADWEYIIERHDGYLPFRVKAVPEGSVVPTSNVLMTVENTDPRLPWITNYVETILSQVWYTSTVATLSYQMKKLIGSYLEKTGTPELIDFKLHDFGYRGVSSVESAGLGGAAHLINFKGTDTLAGIELIAEYYSNGKYEFPGFSVPAAEHSTITSWCQDNVGEVNAFRNMIKQFGDDFPFYAVVSDSYDIYKACSKIWGEELKAEVEAANGTLVVRPDSGTPHVVVPKCLNLLAEKFGFSYNDRGYKVLNPKVRLIQGDGIDYEETCRILDALQREKWSADNVTFGMGGGLLQKVNRDTQKFAFKCSSITIDGREKDVFKKPITDNGKNSKRGRLWLEKHPDLWYKTQPGTSDKDCLEVVFENGQLIRKQMFEDIRKIAEQH